ncbi:major facilitator superfamily domain-containing protein [Mycena crocata]|nr:major facilitator superfamily domain-containing protein [Mycena crocata]
MSAHNSRASLDASSLQSEEIELARRVPLPPSTSTFFIDSELSGPSSSSNDSREIVRSLNESNLPPTDGGLGAWSFLAAAFVVEAVVWGFPNAYGVFLSSYLQDPRYTSQKGATSLLPLIGTLSSGIIYCSGLVVNPIAARYPHHRRKFMWFGAVLCCGTLFGASYATEANLPLRNFQLVLLQGVFYAIGGSLLFLPCISFTSEWFVARRGLANGILFAGNSTGGLLLPLVLPPLISKHGASKTLRILAIAVAVLLVPVLPFVKGRLPQSRVRIHGPAPRGVSGPQDWMKHKSFWICLAANTLQGFAYFVPIVYLPTFANNLHISSSNSAVTLAMLNAATVVGRLSLGYLSDKVNPWLLALSTLLTTLASTFILWGIFSHSFAGLLAFGIVYGTVAGGWSSLWTGFVRPFAKDDPVLSTTLYGYLLLSRGIGNIVSTPISANLYAQTRNVTGGAEKTGFQVGDGRFQEMIIYVGTCFAGAAAVSALGWTMDARKRPQAAQDSE